MARDSKARRMWARLGRGLCYWCTEQSVCSSPCAKGLLHWTRSCCRQPGSISLPPAAFPILMLPQGRVQSLSIPFGAALSGTEG